MQYTAVILFVFFFQAEDGIRDLTVTGVQTCALPIFAYLVYASAWLKRYYPAAFTAALLRNQPMGFYAPHSLINDARRHGVTVHGVDVNASDALATLEGSADSTGGNPAIRLGLSAVRNLGGPAAERVAAGGPYRNL